MTAEENTAADSETSAGSPAPGSFDTIKRFIFNEKDIRGEIVQTCQAYRSLVADHAYPRNIRRLMGEMQAAITLMTETVKFQGSIMLQLRGNGELVYAYINSNEKQETRGLASWNGDIDEFCHWTKLLGKDPILTITIIPEEGSRMTISMNASRITTGTLCRLKPGSGSTATRILKRLREFSCRSCPPTIRKSWKQILTTSPR